jgi:hypothetical protein
LESLGVPSPKSLSLKRGMLSCSGVVEGNDCFFLYTGKDSISIIDFRLAAPFLRAIVSEIVGKTISPFSLIVADS